MITWQNKPILTRMVRLRWHGRTSSKKKINKKKKNNKKPIINNRIANDQNHQDRSYLDRIEGLDVFALWKSGIMWMIWMFDSATKPQVYPDSKVLACLAQYGNVTSTDDGFSSPDGPDITIWISNQRPDKMCMLYWRGSHFFTVILDIQRKHITYCESNLHRQRIGDQSSLIGGSRRLFWNSTSQKGLSVSVISTRLIIRFLLSTTHSRVQNVDGRLCYQFSWRCRAKK
jgi:hypothetical protein